MRVVLSAALKVTHAIDLHTALGLNPGLESVYLHNMGSPVTIMTKLWVGQPEFDSRQGQGLFLFATASIPVLGLTKPRI
jgi:hypothetical protein